MNFDPSQSMHFAANNLLSFCLKWQQNVTANMVICVLWCISMLGYSGWGSDNNEHSYIETIACISEALRICWKMVGKIVTWIVMSAHDFRHSYHDNCENQWNLFSRHQYVLHDHIWSDTHIFWSYYSDDKQKQSVTSLDDWFM